METMTLQTLIAERDRIAAELRKALREAEESICDEWNRLYPVGTKMKEFDADCVVAEPARYDIFAESIRVKVTKGTKRKYYSRINWLKPIEAP